jgi:hypothetical protein
MSRTRFARCWFLFRNFMNASATHMERPIGAYATQDFVQLGETMRVDEALRFIRNHRSEQTLI